jgi:subtilisin family serine protease
MSRYAQGFVFGLITLVTMSGLAAELAQAQPQSKLHPGLVRLLDETDGPVRAWVLFIDKGLASPAARATALDRVAAETNPRAAERRRLRRTAPGLFDEHDLPVVPGYIDQVVATGVRLRVVSRWVNAVSVVADRAQLEAIGALPFVRAMQPVGRSRRVEPVSPSGEADTDGLEDPGRGFYGYAQGQLQQINLLGVHDAGYTGQGVLVGVLDTGFERSHEAFNYPGHELTVLAEWDFINDDGDTAYEPGDDWGQHYHGTLILGTLGAYYPDELVGAAYDASFVLAKTEDTTAEYPAEEDYYVAGLEFLETNGADLATSSLGYIDWYTQSDLDGQTAVTTIAVNIATANGMYCCTAAGNEGHDGDPSTSHLIAPSDALQVIACGAVYSTGEIAGFSSDGPSADGRVKPELLAQGVDTATVWPYDTTGYSTANGTSLSTPLVAGAVACLVGAHPEWSVDQMRAQLFYTAQGYVADGTFDPLYIRGYGVVDAYAALNFSFTDCNGNGIDDAVDLADCDGSAWCSDCNENGVLDECDIADGTSADINQNGVPDECECLGDLDGDLDIDLADLAQQLAHYGATGGVTYPDGDIDSDGDIDLSDLAALLGVYGTTCD